MDSNLHTLATKDLGFICFYSLITPFFYFAINSSVIKRLKSLKCKLPSIFNIEFPYLKEMDHDHVTCMKHFPSTMRACSDIPDHMKQRRHRPATQVSVSVVRRLCPKSCMCSCDGWVYTPLFMLPPCI